MCLVEKSVVQKGIQSDCSLKLFDDCIYTFTDRQICILNSEGSYCLCVFFVPDLRWSTLQINIIHTYVLMAVPPSTSPHSCVCVL